MIMKLFKNLKFQDFIILIVLIVLAIALFVFGDNTEVLNLILGAFIGAFTTATRRDNNENNE